MAKDTSRNLFPAQDDTDQKPVECLGMTFPSDEARQAYFLEKLREKLRDPVFRQVEGFPIGEDEDILAMSDPPYYTACPNPFIEEFLRCHGTPHDPCRDDYRRDPFAADISEGRTDPIYNAHGYHTKVPHKAIMHYLLHYTEPGDVVFDGFCGTGMTGVAAQLCADGPTIQSLGYHLGPDEAVLDSQGRTVSRKGARLPVLGDLSPAASFIAFNYNMPADSHLFRTEGEAVLAEVEAACARAYMTLHEPTPEQLLAAVELLATGGSRALDVARLPLGRVNYVVWSDMFLCSECGGEVVFWDAAVDQQAGKVRDVFPCPHCRADLTKRWMEPALTTFSDPALNHTVRQTKQLPVLVSYTFAGQRYQKRADAFDVALAKSVVADRSASWFPAERMPEGDESRRNDDAGITHSHHFFTPRNLRTLSLLWGRCRTPRTRWLVTGIMQRASRQHQIAISRVGGPKAGEGGATAGHRRGTLYIPSNQVEFHPCDLFRERLTIALKASDVFLRRPESFCLGISSASRTGLPDASVDYIFTDPPFGGNISYSDLNFLWEVWLRVRTNNLPEAVQSKAQGKDLHAYQRLMAAGFAECYRVLKPGRWITVEFHNSQNKVWMAIQEALQQAGFIVADVRTLDKQMKTHTQRTASGTVDKDLAITAYKPPSGLASEFTLEAGTEQGAWAFVRSHLRHVPVFVAKEGRAEIIAERQPFMLFDRMVAFHVQRGYSVPLSAGEFYSLLRQQFPERDGMHFLPEQVADYERQRALTREVEQLQLFVNDEKTAIQWVRQQLAQSPTTYQDLQPLYMREAQRVWEKHEQPLELRTILDQNFVMEPDGTWRVPDARKEADLEQIRNRALLKEFQQYLDTKGKLRVVRTEALRAGFKDCWQRQDYATIVALAKRLPDAVIQEDPALLMYYDNALMRTGE